MRRRLAALCLVWRHRSKLSARVLEQGRRHSPGHEETPGVRILCRTAMQWSPLTRHGLIRRSPLNRHVLI